MDRYLLGEMVTPFVGGAMLFVVILVGTLLYPKIELIVKNNIPFLVVAKLVVFSVPSLIVLTLPAGMALSASWAINRLARDSEVTALRMAGIPVRRLFWPIILVGLIVSGIDFWIGDYLVPRAQHQFAQTEEQMISYAIQASPQVAANRVFTYKDYSFHIREVYKDPKDSAALHLRGVTIFQNPPFGSAFPIIFTAKTADYKREVWTLYEMHTNVFDGDGFVSTEVAGKTMTLNLHVPLNLADTALNRPDELTMAQLGAQMAALRKTHQEDAAVAVNYYSKLALPFICFAFALCAPPLALRFSRFGAYAGIGISVIVVWIAWNTLLLTKFLGVAGKMPPFWAAWAPDLILVALGLFLLARVE